MIQHGIAPFLECSSRGDARFSAFRARLRTRDNRSIEDIYQAAKIFPDGRTGLAWREAKGRHAVNGAEVRRLYATLWDEYIAEQPHLLAVLLAASGLSDSFGQPGHACQATELWRIRTATITQPIAAPGATSAHRPRVLNKKTDRIPPDAIYCGRPSPWGNPFAIGRDGTRADVIAKYEQWIVRQPHLLARLDHLKGRDLICWCSPLPCHCNILLRLANPALFRCT